MPAPTTFGVITYRVSRPGWLFPILGSDRRLTAAAPDERQWWSSGFQYGNHETSRQLGSSIFGSVSGRASVAGARGFARSRGALLAAIALVVGATSATSSSAQMTSVTFVFVGGPETFVVPGGVTTLALEAYGAEGGRGGPDGGAAGSGGRVSTSLSVAPGQSLEVIVGGRGSDAAGLSGGSGGFNGGGPGGGGAPNGVGGGGVGARQRSGSGETPWSWRPAVEARGATAETGRAVQAAQGAGNGGQGSDGGPRLPRGVGASGGKPNSDFTGCVSGARNQGGPGGVSAPK